METELDKVKKKIEAKEKEITDLQASLLLSPNEADKNILLQYSITLNKLMDKEALLGKLLY